MYPYSYLPKPLRTLEFYTLLALAHRQMHAYALISTVHQHSLGSIKLTDGQLYPLLTRLHDQGLIDMLGEKPAGKSGKPRLHYGISDQGAIRLQEEATRLKHAVELAASAGILENPVPTDLQRMIKSLS